MPRPALILVVATVLALSACGMDASQGGGPAARTGADPSSSSPTPTHASRSSVQFRRVLAASPGRCGNSVAHQPLPPLPTQPPAGSGADVCASTTGMTYRLAPAEVVGGVARAVASLPPGQSQWAVMVTLDSSARRDFARMTAALAGTGKQVAIVVDDRVVTAVEVSTAITDGRVEISGSFNRAFATSLAAALRR